MRFLLIASLSLVLSMHAFSEPANVLYYDFFGDFLNEKSYDLDIDVDRHSIKDIKEMLAAKRAEDPRCACFICKAHEKGIDANLVIIGYGKKGQARDFFAATKDINESTPLAQALGTLPVRKNGQAWRIFFINREISKYVTENLEVHWASPFSALAEIRKQDLKYFP